MRHYLGCLTVFAACSAATTATAQDAATFYKGRTITVVIGSTSGGGYDTYGRLLSRHIGKHIPGTPTVVASNMPGAGSNTAANHVVTSGKDGTMIGAIFAGVIVEPLLGDRGKQRFDPSKLVFLGNANREVFTCVVRGELPVKSFADFRSRELVVGASAAGGATVDFPLMLNQVLGTRLRVVRGYPGTRQITLAVEKGEVDGVCGLSWATTSVQYPRTLAEGMPLRLIVQEDMTGHPTLNAAGIPVSASFAANDADRQALALFYAQNGFGRPFVLAPDTPADRVAVLRTAFDAAMKDPDLLAEARKLNVDIVPSTGAEVQSAVARMYATSTDVVARVRKVLGHND